MSTLPALKPNGNYVDSYADEIAGGLAGTLCRFKDGKFIVSESLEEMDIESDYLALVPETRISWIKFNEDGTPPERHAGLLYQGYTLPPRSSLGDTDEAQWPQLNDRPEDPWKHSIELVLQNKSTLEIFCFSTMTSTGRRAVGNLLRHYNRAVKADPNYLPLVKLRAGGFKHRDSRIGFVTTPSFAVVGQARREDAPVPNVVNDMNDEIPF